jgi:hypothetical protein
VRDGLNRQDAKKDAKNDEGLTAENAETKGENTRIGS